MLAPGFGHVQAAARWSYGRSGQHRQPSWWGTEPQRSEGAASNPEDGSKGADPPLASHPRVGSGFRVRFAPRNDGGADGSSVLQRRRFAVPSPPAPPASGIGVSPLRVVIPGRSRAPRRGDPGIQVRTAVERPVAFAPRGRQRSGMDPRVALRFASLALGW